MNTQPDAVVAHFADRAANYARSDWHEEYARGLVAVAGLKPGDHVLDVGAGTGMAARAAAERVGDAGSVKAADVSEEMLAQLRQSDRAGAATVDVVVADATRLPFPDEHFDVVLCSAALLYLPVAAALAEQRRVLRDGGVIGFSTMRAGQPPAAALFRELAGARGVALEDRSAGLGSQAACRSALRTAGFSDIEVHSARVRFTARDLHDAWEANERGVRAELAALDPAERDGMRAEFAHALADSPGDFDIGHVLYATARRP